MITPNSKILSIFLEIVGLLSRRSLSVVGALILFCSYAFSQTGNLEIDGNLKVDQGLRVNGRSFLWDNQVDIGHFNAPDTEIPGMSIIYQDGGFSSTKFLSNRWGSEWIWQNQSPTGIKDRMKLDNFGSLFLYGDDGGMTLPNIYLSPTFGYGHYPMIKLESDSENIQIGGDANGITINGAPVLTTATRVLQGWGTATPDSIVLGFGGTATGFRSIAFNSSRALGETAVAFGQESEAAGQYSVAGGIGSSVSANGYGSVALGHCTYTDGRESFAGGSWTKALGSYSTTLGYISEARAYQTVVGVNNAPIGSLTDWVDTDPVFIVGNGLEIGHFDNPGGTRNNAMVVRKNGSTEINGRLIVSGGKYYTATAEGDGANAIGRASSASGQYSLALGLWSKALNPFETVIGINNSPLTSSGETWNLNDPLFVIGNGKPDTNPNGDKSNALVMKKNGDTTVYGNLSSTKKITAQDITATGKIIVQPQGDLSMGEFTAGGQ